MDQHIFCPWTHSRHIHGHLFSRVECQLLNWMDLWSDPAELFVWLNHVGFLSCRKVHCSNTVHFMVVHDPPFCTVLVAATKDEQPGPYARDHPGTLKSVQVVGGWWGEWDGEGEDWGMGECWDQEEGSTNILSLITYPGSLRVAGTDPSRPIESTRIILGQRSKCSLTSRRHLGFRIFLQDAAHTVLVHLHWQGKI